MKDFSHLQSGCSTLNFYVMKLLVIYEYDRPRIYAIRAATHTHTPHTKVYGKMNTEITKDQNQQLDYKGENVAKCEAKAA